MPLRIVENDITKISCDAIVNAANSALRPGGGVDGAIHRAAGPGLYEECRKLDGCPTGEARLTGGYDLPGKYVIHTAGPVWQGGGFGEEALLRSCYRSALAIAKDLSLESIAFPLISAGVYRYPKAEALRIAVEEIASFERENDILVFLVIYDRSSFDIGSELFDSLASFIDSNYRPEAPLASRPALPADQPLPDIPGAERAEKRKKEKPAPRGTAKKESAGKTAYATPSCGKTDILSETISPFRSDNPPSAQARNAEGSLEAALAQIDESFSEMLLRKIDEKQMTDVECYKKANIDRKLFSKIRGDRLYRPSKPTAIAFAVALELPLPEAKEMLMKAGYALSRSSRFDIIIEYFISKGNYDINEINEALFAFDQVLLGA